MSSLVTSPQRLPPTAPAQALPRRGKGSWRHPQSKRTNRPSFAHDGLKLSCDSYHAINILIYALINHNKLTSAGNDLAVASWKRWTQAVKWPACRTNPSQARTHSQRNRLGLGGRKMSSVVMPSMPVSGVNPLCDRHGVVHLGAWKCCIKSSGGNSQWLSEIGLKYGQCKQLRPRLCKTPVDLQNLGAPVSSSCSLSTKKKHRSTAHVWQIWVCLSVVFVWTGFCSNIIYDLW